MANKKETSILNVQPQSLEGEQAVLGSMLTNKEAVAKAMQWLSPEHFYKDAHSKIFSVMIGLFHDSEPIDTISVVDKLKKNKELKSVGGAYYITGLVEAVPTTANVESYAKIVLEKALLRQLILLSHELASKAYDDREGVDDILDSAERAIFNITQKRLKGGFISLEPILHDSFEALDAKSAKGGMITGIPSGLVDLDNLTAGFHPGELIVIAGRPSMGKCLGKGTKVLMFSGELKKVEEIKDGELLMGDNSTPRRVLSISRGREKMYWVKQNKGIDYRVNEAHILSLKRSRNENKYKHGDVLNITVKEYLRKSSKFKSNYKGYKVPVEFQEEELSIEPYFLGIWLGDGRKSDVRIATQDKEIVDYLDQYALRLNLSLSVYSPANKCPMYAITGKGKVNHKLSLQHKLRILNLLNSKHIPQGYLINTKNNRLELLAGLIDSDGYYDEQCNGYEITQKNKNLAKEIKFLCDSLGFRTSLISKIAGIKSIGYETTVYRVRFFGDIDQIPVKISRKKAKEWNCKRSWNQTGITVEYDKIDDYYGFEIDDNRLFLLEDMTVTHNTALALTIARNAAVDNKHGVGIFSLEMANQELAMRMLCSEARVNSHLVRTGKLPPKQWKNLSIHVGVLAEAPIYIDDSAAVTVLEVRSKARRLMAENNIELIIVDYLQLMQGPRNVENRQQEISVITRSLKALAKELNIPVIALSQLSRAVEQRGGDKRPILSDLRESGAIEQDADVVMFLYRKWFYEKFKQSDSNIDDFEDQTDKRAAEIIISKQRNGPTGTVKTVFIEQYARFENLARYTENIPYSKSDQEEPPF